MLLTLRQRVSGLWSRLAFEGDSRSEDWVVDASRMAFRERLGEFWRYRRVFWFFCKNMATRQYQGTSLGVLWLFARPLMPVAINTLVFGAILQIASDGVPYFLFHLVSMMSWHLFDRALLFATRSLDMNRNLTKKVYFPRLIIPFSSVSSSLTEAGVYVLIIVGAAIYYLWKDSHWYLRFGPELLLSAYAATMSVLLAVAIGLWTSVWMLKFRDLRYGLRYFTRFWMYVSAVIFPVSTIPPEYRWVIFVNPMAPFIETFRWGVLGIGTLYTVPLVTATLTVVVIMLGGLWYFGRAEAASIDRM